MPIATFVIALLALVTSMAALTWSIWQYLLTGSRARISMVGGALAGGGEVVTVTAGPDMMRELSRLSALKDLGDPVLGVVVYNRGRALIRVQRWGISVPGTATWWTVGHSMGPDFPAVVEAGAQQAWFVAPEPAIRLAHASDGIKEARPPVRAIVELGNGKRLLSSESVQLLPEREAEEAARRYRLVRSATAQRGRSFELLGALFRRTARARAAAARRAACRASIG